MNQKRSVLAMSFDSRGSIELNPGIALGFTIQNQHNQHDRCIRVAVCLCIKNTGAHQQLSQPIFLQNSEY